MEIPTVWLREFAAVFYDPRVVTSENPPMPEQPHGETESESKQKLAHHCHQ
jgi:hypothetical protein